MSIYLGKVKIFLFNNKIWKKIFSQNEDLVFNKNSYKFPLQNMVYIC